MTAAARRNPLPLSRGQVTRALSISVSRAVGSGALPEISAPRSAGIDLPPCAFAGGDGRVVLKSLKQNAATRAKPPAL